MRDFKTLRIVSSIENRIKSSFFAEFFRFCGIYVVEDLVAENESVASSEEYDFTLYFTNLTKNISELNGEEKLQWLLDIIDSFSKDESNSEIRFEKDAFCAIATIYASGNLSKYLANIQYYRINYGKQEETLQALMSAYKQLSVLEPRNRTIEYATLYCASKANVACYALNELFVYDIERLSKECLQLIRTYPSFGNVWALRGLIYEYDAEYGSEAVNAFRKAMECEKNDNFTSEMLYMMAKRYRAYDANRKDAIEFYEKSNQAKPSYKTMYHLAMLLFKQENYSEAIRWFCSVIDNLTKKNKAGYLDPLECEYYYKSNSLLAYIYCVRLKNYEPAIDCALNAYNFIEKLEENKFFKNLYGEENKEYLKVSKGRTSLEKICQYLAVSNRELRRFDESEKWWAKASEFYND